MEGVRCDLFLRFGFWFFSRWVLLVDVEEGIVFLFTGLICFLRFRGLDCDGGGEGRREGDIESGYAFGDGID